MSPLPDVPRGNDEPLYNIGAVSRMTGVSMATLRAWERRYKFPEAQRTAGGHRLYSERAVMRLRWVKERIDEGMQTSQAIQALHHQEQSGNLALIQQAPSTPGEAASLPSAHLGPYETQLYKRLVAQDTTGADTLLAEALAVSSPESIILDVISPVMSSIGAAWEDGKLSVAAEHLATNYLRQRLMMWMLGGPPPKAVRPIALACAPGEWHEGSLLVLGAFLRRRRWPVAYLGQAVPFGDLEGFLDEMRPPLVVLVAMGEESAAELARWPEGLPKTAESGKPAVSFGGRIFVNRPEWVQRIPGHYLGDTFQEGLVNIERLLPQGL